IVPYRINLLSGKRSLRAVVNDFFSGFHDQFCLPGMGYYISESHFSFLQYYGRPDAIDTYAESSAQDGHIEVRSSDHTPFWARFFLYLSDRKMGFPLQYHPPLILRI